MPCKSATTRQRFHRCQPKFCRLQTAGPAGWWFWSYKHIIEVTWCFPKRARLKTFSVPTIQQYTFGVNWLQLWWRFCKLVNRWRPVNDEWCTFWEGNTILINLSHLRNLRWGWPSGLSPWKRPTSVSVSVQFLHDTVHGTVRSGADRFPWGFQDPQPGWRMAMRDSKHDYIILYYIWLFHAQGSIFSNSVRCGQKFNPMDPNGISHRAPGRSSVPSNVWETIAQS